MPYIKIFKVSYKRKKFNISLQTEQKRFQILKLKLLVDFKENITS